MKISIIGCTGRMGAELIKKAHSDINLELVSGYGAMGEVLSQEDLGELAGIGDIGVFASSDLTEIIKKSDGIIDFSGPKLSLQVAELASFYKKILVTGSTGFSQEDFTQYKSFAKNSAFLWASNMSIGINVLNKLIFQAGKLLNSDFDTEIVEMHHKYKKDAPSGTAITLGKTIASSKNIDFKKVARLSREGLEEERSQDEIGFATLRGGSVIGDHKVIFASDDERIEISHKAINRSVFATGAIYLIKKLTEKKAGFYQISDII